ncbi:Thyrotropin-releasing hormone receptor [Acropora cervicornis]|uniref:Thyrotropin-releasing hormone receptor n=1 Tax=Acropora cervicornis TaxID=6130 RepID=A0AAD9Q6K6_ACRCE|nr:Thyrotropin-releasing hormone receptor [Acropora cervicornis]
MNNTTVNATPEVPLTGGPTTAFLISGTFLAVVCPLTVLSNVLLLVAIYKGPTFRTPSACFLVGLAFVDLITGLIPEPMLISCYFMLYNGPNSGCTKAFDALGYLIAITTNTSYFIVLAFTLVQYVAVAFPFKFQILITRRRIAACVAGLFSYATLFEIIRAVGAPKETMFKIDLILHSTVSLLVTIITYLLLQRAFGKQMKHRRLTLSTTNTAVTEESPETNRASRRPQSSKRTPQQLIEKNFVRLNLMLIVILLVCSQPSAIFWYIYLYSDEETKQKIWTARVIADNTLYLKFLLDPFLFAWRMPKYRNALKNVFARE